MMMVISFALFFFPAIFLCFVGYAFGKTAERGFFFCLFMFSILPRPTDHAQVLSPVKPVKAKPTHSPTQKQPQLDGAPRSLPGP
jgi:hypothetical protein